jgi:hypothetical protein
MNQTQLFSNIYWTLDDKSHAVVILSAATLILSHKSVIKAALILIKRKDTGSMMVVTSIHSATT